MSQKQKHELGQLLLQLHRELINNGYPGGLSWPLNREKIEITVMIPSDTIKTRVEKKMEELNKLAKGLFNFKIINSRTVRSQDNTIYVYITENPVSDNKLLSAFRLNGPEYLAINRIMTSLETINLEYLKNAILELNLKNK